MKDYRHPVRSSKLLKYTGQQSDCRSILEKLKRHELAVQALKKQGLAWNSEKGVITPLAPLSAPKKANVAKEPTP
jgi:hypothetical protein